MKGLVKFARGEGHLEIREIADPRAGEQEVVIQVKAAGICGSDLHIYKDDVPWPLAIPVVIGHEFSGVIAEVGNGVHGLQNGDRVTAETAFEVCGDCVLCRTGRYNLCAARHGIGYLHHGAFADKVVVPATRIHRLPDTLSFVDAALLEPLACVVHGVIESTVIEPGDWVLVSGVGAIGLLAAQVARTRGGKVILTCLLRDEMRAKTARTLGFDTIITADKELLYDRIAEVVGPDGVDVVIECSGSTEAVAAGLRVVKRGGCYLQMGLLGRPATIDIDQIGFKELRVSGSSGQRWTAWRRAISLLASNMVQTHPLISDILSLEDWHKGFTKALAKEALKVVLVPGERNP